MFSLYFTTSGLIFIGTNLLLSCMGFSHDDMKTIFPITIMGCIFWPVFVPAIIAKYACDSLNNVDK